MLNEHEQKTTSPPPSRANDTSPSSHARHEGWHDGAQDEEFRGKVDRQGESAGGRGFGSHRSGSDLFFDRSLHRGSSHDDRQQENQRRGRNNGHDASGGNRERYLTQSYGDRSHNARFNGLDPHRRPYRRPQAAPFRRRSISRERERGPLPWSRYSSVSIPVPLPNHRSHQPRERSSQPFRRSNSPRVSDRRPAYPQSSRPYHHQQSRGGNPEGWWRGDLSVEENYQRGWSRIPREYRVFVRDSVSPTCRIVDDRLWRPEYSPAENMEYFLSMIPIAFREGFGEFLSEFERGNQAHQRR